MFIKISILLLISFACYYQNINCISADKFCPQIQALTKSIEGFTCEYKCMAAGVDKTIASGSCVRKTSDKNVCDMVKPKIAELMKTCSSIICKEIGTDKYTGDFIC